MDKQLFEILSKISELYAKYNDDDLLDLGIDVTDLYNKLMEDK